MIGVSPPQPAIKKPHVNAYVWPSDRTDKEILQRVVDLNAVRAVLAGYGRPVPVEMVAGGFNGRLTQKRLAEVSEILEMLAALGQIVENEGKFATQT